LAKTRQIIESWRREHNESRPHRALEERIPNEFAHEIAASGDLTRSEEAEKLALEVV
jgi:putative transposase